MTAIVEHKHGEFVTRQDLNLIARTIHAKEMAFQAGGKPVRKAPILFRGKRYLEQSA